MGWNSFQRTSQVTQSVGLVYKVAITMSLVLNKRTKFLQDELNENIQKQADEAEKQKVVLENLCKSEQVSFRQTRGFR